jgi:hypothetical protein
LHSVALTGTGEPDFAIQGCGAGDNNCLSVVSHAGGRWHLVPFEYGYGRSFEVNGVPSHHLVSTEVDACGCAGRPSTWMFERYRNGVFRPTAPPRRPGGCNTATFQSLAYGWQVKVLEFDQVAYAEGWAVAVGTGAGYSGKLVGLFIRNGKGWSWRLLTIDNGNALPAAPSIYDLPVSLLRVLTARIGNTLVAEEAAADLIARLQLQYRFSWPLQEGIVDAGGSRWLIAVVPAGRAKHTYDAGPVGAVIYRWSGRTWVRDGHIPHIPLGMNLGYYDGWFVSAPTAGRSAVAFRVAGSDMRYVLTNHGGYWHVARRAHGP